MYSADSFGCLPSTSGVAHRSTVGVKGEGSG